MRPLRQAPFSNERAKAASCRLYRFIPEGQVRTGLAAGGKWIRTSSSCREAVNRDGRRTGCPEIGTDLLRNRRFESISLQQRVRCEPDFRTLPSMTVSSAGHVSMASIRLDAREQRRPSVMPSIGLVIAGRFVQGLGGGLLSALAYVLVRNVFPEDLWPRVFGLFEGTSGSRRWCISLRG